MRRDLFGCSLYLDACIAALTDAFITPQLEKKRMRLAESASRRVNAKRLPGLMNETRESFSAMARC
jgi:hypothetical protein